MAHYLCDLKWCTLPLTEEFSCHSVICNIDCQLNVSSNVFMPLNLPERFNWGGSTQPWMQVTSFLWLGSWTERARANVSYTLTSPFISLCSTVTFARQSEAKDPAFSIMSLNQWTRINHSSLAPSCPPSFFLPSWTFARPFVTVMRKWRKHNSTITGTPNKKLNKN